MGIAGSETLGTIDAVFGGSAKPVGPQQGVSAKEAWESKAVPRAHEKVDKVFSTNLVITVFFGE